MTVSKKNRSQGPKISRWGLAALPLSVFVGVVLGAVVGAAVAHIGIGVVVGAGFGRRVGVAVSVAAFLFWSSEPPGFQRSPSLRPRIPPSGPPRPLPSRPRPADDRGTM